MENPNQVTGSGSHGLAAGAIAPNSSSNNASAARSRMPVCDLSGIIL
jgi:hypothetical protein